MQFSTKKNGGKFFFVEKMPKGGGSGGGLAKDKTFSGFSFVHPSLTISEGTRTPGVTYIGAQYVTFV